MSKKPAKSNICLDAGCPRSAPRIANLLSVLLLVLASAFATAQGNWRAKLQAELPLLGHRNWIVIADSAYPLQTSAGVETIDTEASQEEVLATVFKELSLARHIAPIIYTDSELPFLTEAGAPGVEAYRVQVKKILGAQPVQSMPHVGLINMLDDAGKTFHVLVLKTTLTVPYTSVFLRLDCKYWNEAAEKELRLRIKSSTAQAPALTNPRPQSPNTLPKVEKP